VETLRTCGHIQGLLRAVKLDNGRWNVGWYFFGVGAHATCEVVCDEGNHLPTSKPAACSVSICQLPQAVLAVWSRAKGSENGPQYFEQAGQPGQPGQQNCCNIKRPYPGSQQVTHKHNNQMMPANMQASIRQQCVLTMSCRQTHLRATADPWVLLRVLLDGVTFTCIT